MEKKERMGKRRGEGGGWREGGGREGGKLASPMKSLLAPSPRTPTTCSPPQNASEHHKRIISHSPCPQESVL